MPRKVSARLGRSRTTTLLSWAPGCISVARAPLRLGWWSSPPESPPRRARAEARLDFRISTSRARARIHRSTRPLRPLPRGPGAHPSAARGRGQRAPRGRRVLTVPARSPCRGGAVHAAAQPFHAPRRQPHAPGLAAPRATTLPSAGRAAINPAPHAATPSPCKIPDTSSTTVSQH